MKNPSTEAQSVTEKPLESSTPAEPQPSPPTLEYYEVIMESSRPKQEVEALALLEIHDRHLYRLKYRSFGRYLWERWKKKPARGYQLLGWARLLKASTGTESGGPVNERQARCLDAQGQVRKQRERDWIKRGMDYMVKAWNGLAPGEHREFLHHLRLLLDDLEQELGRAENTKPPVVGPACDELP